MEQVCLLSRTWPGEFFIVSTMLSKTAGVRELTKDSHHPLLCVYRSSQAFGDVWKTVVVLSPHTPPGPEQTCPACYVCFLVSCCCAVGHPRFSAMYFPVAVWTKFSRYGYISALCPVRSVGFFQCCRRMMTLRVKISTRAESLTPKPRSWHGKVG